MKCGVEFTSQLLRHKYCSELCRGQRNISTADQYRRLDNNVSLYLNKLVKNDNNNPKNNRTRLTRSMLFIMLDEQFWCCAISGIPLTFRAEKGVQHPYNASIDRIVPASKGGTYQRNNVQLVCKVVNTAMMNMPKEMFIELCVRIARRNRRE
jgi:hypothetical protein